MSLQKPSSRLRFQSNVESHTKNKLINSLINQKLSQQKQVVLNRYVKLAKKASQQKQPHQQQTQFQIRKRSSSLKKINISMQKIKESLTFNPIKLTQEAQFVITRQYSSPLLSEQQISQVSSLRQKANLFQVKLSSKDRQEFEYVMMETPQKDENTSKWVKKVEDSLDNQLWLPGLPHSQQLLENLQESGSAIKLTVPDFDKLAVVRSPTFSEHGNSFTPIVGSIPSRNQHSSAQQHISLQNSTTPTTKLLKLPTTQREQLLYDFKKYHKDDYLALEKWFEKNIISAHKKYPPPSATSITSQQSNQKSLLNLLYTIHIGGMQQLIRLTYVEIWQKALIMEKVFWSLIRLFSGLMQEQHKINYSQYKTFQKQIKQQREMYEQRCSKLQIMMLRAQTETKSTQTLRQRLSLAYVTYSRVNRHLSQELQFTTRQLSDLQHAHNFMVMKFMKVIDFLEEEEKIKKIVDDQETVYYLRVGKKDKLEEVMRFRTGKEERKKAMKKRAQEDLKTKMEMQGKSINDSKYKNEFQKTLLTKRLQIQTTFNQDHTQQVFQTRIGQQILKVQHQLNKYWHSKQQSLKVKQITDQQLLNYTTCDIGTSTYEKFSSQEFGCQFPEQQQKSFAQFLKQEIEKEKQQHEKELHKQEDLYVSLKELYEESYAKVKTLEVKRSQLNLELDHVKELLVKKQGKIRELEVQLSLKNSQLLAKSHTIETLLTKKHHLSQTITSNQAKTLQLEQKFTHELENSQSLVRSNFKMKEQIEKLSIKLQQVESSLHQNQTKKGQIQIQLHKTEEDLDQFRTKYEKLHKNLLKIAPSVDSFLDFKRYDRESIVIASVKKDLEKYFAQYFCKDSDVFLTK